MIEKFENHVLQREKLKNKIKEKRAEIIKLAESLIRKKESLPFFGIDPIGYSKIKATEEEYPDFTTPVDEIIKRLEKEGMKIVLSETDSSMANVFVMPLASDNIEKDSLPVRDLQIKEDMDENLKNLVLKMREFKKLLKL